MKSIGIMSRKPGTTRADFAAYYEKTHAPLALRLLPLETYVRNHLHETESAATDFDTISEFWLEDFAPVFALMEGEVGAQLRADEVNFMDYSRTRACGAEEHLLRGDPHASPTAGTMPRKTALMLKRAPVLDAAAFGAALKTWGAALPADRVSLDLISPWSEGWPCEAIMWLWGETDIPPPPAGVVLWRTLPVTAYENGRPAL